MPLPDITSLAEDDTFQTLFNTNNTMIDRLNLLDIANIIAGSGITYTGPNTVGGITLTIDTSVIEEIGFKVSNTVPTGLTLGSPIGITGATFGTVSNLSVGSSRKFLGIISKLYPDGYRITTSGRIITGVTLTDHTLYYLSNGGITSTLPTNNGEVIKPVLFSIGLTYGAVVLDQRETLISESSSYIKSASRVIAEIPSNPGFSAGNVVFYDVTGSTWAKSNANAHNRSEVFGVIESISGITATVVTHGSVTIPSTMFHNMGQTGGTGGNDIWFLSGTTAGHLQNLGPTLANHIVKPVYYAYPHEFSGVTFSGLVVNYIGYSVANTTVSTTTTIPLNSIFFDPFLYGTLSSFIFTNYRIGGQLIVKSTNLYSGLLVNFLETLSEGSGIIFPTAADGNELFSVFANTSQYNAVVQKFNAIRLLQYGYLIEVTATFTTPPAGGYTVYSDGSLLGAVVGQLTTGKWLIYINPNIGLIGDLIFNYSGDIAVVGGETWTDLVVVGYVLPDYGTAPYWYMKLG